MPHEGHPPIVSSPVTEEEIKDRHRKTAEAALKSIDDFSRTPVRDLRLASALRNLHAYEADIDHCLTSEMVTREEAESRILNAKTRIVECLILLGRLDEAIEKSQQWGLEELHDESRKYYEAVHCPDDQICDCSHQEVDGMSFPVHSATDEFFSERHGGWTPVLRCSSCGCTNITPLIPSHVFVDQFRGDGRPDDRIFKSKK